MNFIIIDPRTGQPRSFVVNWVRFKWCVALAVGSLVATVCGLSVWAYSLDQKHSDLINNQQLIASWQEKLINQDDQINSIKTAATREINALTARMGQLQARLIRLDALGERLTSIAQLDEGEFDFSSQPAVGGPEIYAQPDISIQAPEFLNELDKLAFKVGTREQELELLTNLMQGRQIQKDIKIAGRPITKGWMSSAFGRRSDPIHGRPSWHNGVDFAGKQGSDVVAVAAGVVTWSGKYSGYGKMIEINHGDGLSTRYGHHQALLVKAGDIVKKGQKIGLMGSSGRSTGPHVHFEVWKNGRAVNPNKYVNR